MKEMNGEFFARKLKELRINYGLTQYAFAKAVNLSRSCVANYEAGRRRPGKEIIGYIADCFGMGREYFSEEEDN